MPPAKLVNYVATLLMADAERVQLKHEDNCFSMRVVDDGDWQPLVVDDDGTTSLRLVEPYAGVIVLAGHYERRARILLIDECLRCGDVAPTTFYERSQLAARIVRGVHVPRIVMNVSALLPTAPRERMIAHFDLATSIAAPHAAVAFAAALPPGHIQATANNSHIIYYHSTDDTAPTYVEAIIQEDEDELLT